MIALPFFQQHLFPLYLTPVLIDGSVNKVKSYRIMQRGWTFVSSLTVLENLWTDQKF